MGSAAKFFGTAGRVAACDDDLRVGIRAREPSNGLPRPLVGAGGHRTGVHDDDVGLSGGPGRAPRPQLLLETERVGLVDAAAERDDGVLDRCFAVITKDTKDTKAK